MAALESPELEPELALELLETEPPMELLDEPEEPEDELELDCCTGTTGGSGRTSTTAAAATHKTATHSALKAAAAAQLGTRGW